MGPLISGKSRSIIPFRQIDIHIFAEPPLFYETPSRFSQRIATLQQQLPGEVQRLEEAEAAKLEEDAKLQA